MSEENQVKWIGVRPTSPLERLGISWDYPDSSISESQKDTDTAAGNILLTCSAVPSGEIWRIENIVAWNQVSAITTILIYAHDGSNAITLRRVAAPPANTEVLVCNPITLLANGTIRAYFLGCALHDNIQLHIHGMKLNI
jgi:hypothetical protein